MANERKSALRAERLAAGLCPYCGKDKPIPGQKHCEACRQHRREQKAKWARKVGRVCATTEYIPQAVRTANAKRHRSPAFKDAPKPTASADTLERQAVNAQAKAKQARIATMPKMHGRKRVAANWWGEGREHKHARVYDRDAGEIPFRAHCGPPYCLDLFVRDAVKLALFTCGMLPELNQYEYHLDRDGFIRYRRCNG